MSLRRVVGVAVLATASVLLPAIPSGAVPSRGSCNPYPPSAGETLTIDASPTTAVAGQQVLAFGSFSQGGCPIRNAVIHIRRQVLVNGVPTGTWSNVSSATTTARGAYAVSISVLRNERLRAHFNASGAFTSANSNIINEGVRTKVTLVVDKLGNCRLGF